MDFPEDGSNRFISESLNFDQLWRPGLLDAIRSMEKVVLVTHSVSAMLALTFPELDALLKGFVIISSAPSSKWREGVMQRANGKNLPSISEKHQAYENNKSDEAFKAFFLSIVDYYVQPPSKLEAVTLFNQLSYHYQRYEWSIDYLHKGYRANWVPNQVPTLILASPEDVVTPISLFQEESAFSENHAVKIVSIPDAGHFPWIEQPHLVKQQFFSYLLELEQQKL